MNDKEFRTCNKAFLKLLCESKDKQMEKALKYY